MTDSSDDQEKYSSEDQEKVEYVKKDLFQPISRPWQHRSQDDKSVDEDSNHFFMSEPSISEAESSDHHLRLLSPMESLTDDQSIGDDFLPPPPPPRLLTTQAPASPGNTSLSSWESPHWNRRIHLHFSPDPKEDRRQNNSNGQRGFIHPVAHHHAVPPQASTPDREFASDNQQSSVSEVSSGQRRADQFLRDLRMSSEGQVRESLAVANDSSFDSSYHMPNHHERMQNVLRRTATAAAQQEHAPSADTEVARNTTSTSDLAYSERSQDLQVTPTDDTIVMTLSASEDERDTTTNPESGRPLDWEQQNSADDEKTAVFKPRIRTRGKVQAHRRQRSFGDGKQPGHRRQRSGDAAAATLSTGSADWKGMGQHKIPLAPVPGEEDDEDEDHGQTNNKRLQEREKDGKSNQTTFAKTTVDGSQDYRIPSNSAGDIAQFSMFALGSDAPAATTSRRSARRPRRDFRPRRKSWLELDSEESSSVTSNDFSPRFAFQNPHSRHVRVASHPVPSSAGFGPSSWSEDMSPFSQPSQQNSLPPPNPPNPSFQFGTYHHGDSEGQFSPRWQNSSTFSERTHSFDLPSVNSSHHSAWFQAAKTERPGATAEEGMGSPTSALSWLSGKLGGGTGKKTEVDPESLSLLEKQGPKVETVRSDDRDTSYSFQASGSESYDLSEGESRDRFISHVERKGDDGPSMGVIRNPFENLNNRGFDRRRFSVQTNATPADEKKFQTYICPVCNTRQREFFTVSSAPKTFESASGYIAFYFSIYVIAALYVFGLQVSASEILLLLLPFHIFNEPIRYLLFRKDGVSSIAYTLLVSVAKYLRSR
jgi:hypothetical protein